MKFVVSGIVQVYLNNIALLIAFVLMTEQTNERSFLVMVFRGLSYTKGLLSGCMFLSRSLPSDSCMLFDWHLSVIKYNSYHKTASLSTLTSHTTWIEWNNQKVPPSPLTTWLDRLQYLQIVNLPYTFQN